MITNNLLFERLIAEAVAQPFEGWDFSFLEGRWGEELLPWDYRQVVSETLVTTHCLLDMGTGGGEFLASLQPLPVEIYATESYPPNVPVARARLEPLGCRVVTIESDENLPFEDSMFDTVINRHERFIAEEVARILRPGGTFITQQVGSRNLEEIRAALQRPKENRPSSYVKALDYLREAGLEILETQEAAPQTEFYDVGAMVYLLRVVPWEAPGFSVKEDVERLAEIHNEIQATGRFIARDDRFYIKARKGSLGGSTDL